MLALLLLSGVAGAQTSTAPTETADIAAIRVKANAGDAEAQADLGYAYVNGRGVPQDAAQAAAWTRKAADQGLAVAQSNLAVMYRDCA